MVSVLAAVALLLSSRHVPRQSTLKAHDDRDVIQIAMLSFFKHEEWHSADWRPKSQVVLRSKYTRESRPQFAAELQSAIERARGGIDYAMAELRKGKLKATSKQAFERELKQSQADLAALSEVGKHQSPNGRYAALNLAIPWSIHGSAVYFVFERINGSWVRRVVQARFYV